MTHDIFTTLRSVAVPVTDQDRTRVLFEETGSTTAMDAELQPGFRWIEMSPPGGGTVISLVMTGDETADRSRHGNPTGHPLAAARH